MSLLSPRERAPRTLSRNGLVSGRPEEEVPGGAAPFVEAAL